MSSRRREPPSGLTEEDRALLRTIGGYLSQIIHGQAVDVPDVQRRDEIGILANMVARVSKELERSRRRDADRRRELEARVAELQSAYETQERLVATIRELSSPILALHPGVLLLPIIGTLTAARVAVILLALTARISDDRPDVAIIDVTGTNTLDADVLSLLLHGSRTTRGLGASIVLAGVGPAALAAARERGIDLSSMTTCESLPEALSIGLEHVGYRITR